MPGDVADGLAQAGSAPSRGRRNLLVLFFSVQDQETPYVAPLLPFSSAESMRHI